MAQAQVEKNVFLRDYHGLADGDLFLPVDAMPIDKSNGPFTENDLRGRIDWPTWQCAVDDKFEQIFIRDVFKNRR